MGNHKYRNLHVAIHVMHMLQQHKCRVIVAITLAVSEVNPSKITFPSNLNSVGKTALPSLTRSSLTRSSWQSGNRLVNAPPGDVTIRTADPGWLMKASGVQHAAFWCSISGKFWRFKHVIVTQSSKPKPCACSSTEGNLWIKSSDTKNASFHRFSSLLQR